MASGGMKYVVKASDGNEYGPVDQDTLEQWAQTGRITTKSQIRNALLQKWNSADKTPFLKDIIAKQAQDDKKGGGSKTSLSELISPKSEDLSQSGSFKFTPAATGIRAAAWLVDTAIVLGIGFGLLIATSSFIQDGMEKSTAFILFTLVFLACTLMYYTISLGFMAQSLGQMFWGLMVVRTEGEPVLMGRAFVFSVCYLLFFWSSLLFVFCLPSKRAIQDLLSGIRVVKTTVSS